MDPPSPANAIGGASPGGTGGPSGVRLSVKRREERPRAQQQQQQQQYQTKASVTAAAEAQQPRSGFAGWPLPGNLVAVDRLGFKKAIARDEKLCCSYEARIKSTKDLLEAEEKLTNCIIKDLREKLHTEIALKRVIEEDDKKCLEAIRKPPPEKRNKKPKRSGRKKKG